MRYGGSAGPNGHGDAAPEYRIDQRWDDDSRLIHKVVC